MKAEDFQEGTLGHFLGECLEDAEDYRVESGIKGRFEVADLTRILGDFGYGVQFDQDTLALMKGDLEEKWIGGYIGRFMLNYMVGCQIGAIKSGCDSEGAKKDGVPPADDKVRVRLPKALRKRKQARRVGREKIAARVIPALAEEARARGNVSQCVEAGLKLLFGG